MTVTMNQTSDTTTRALLAGGVIGGPLFIIVVVLQEFTREGFDPKRHTLSQLSCSASA